MRIDRGIVLTLLSLATLAACGMVQDMADAQAKSDAIAAALEKEVGSKPLVGWNINNGALTDVTVVFPLAGVSTLPVGELEAKVRAVVNKGFETPPKHLTVSVTSSQ